MLHVQNKTWWYSSCGVWNGQKIHKILNRWTRECDKAKTETLAMNEWAWHMKQVTNTHNKQINIQQVYRPQNRDHKTLLPFSGPVLCTCISIATTWNVTYPQNTRNMYTVYHTMELGKWQTAVLSWLATQAVQRHLLFKYWKVSPSDCGFHTTVYTTHTRTTP